MSVILYNPDGSPNCGDPEFGFAMRAEADRVRGHVVDAATGAVVYDARVSG